MPCAGPRFRSGRSYVHWRSSSRHTLQIGCAPSQRSFFAKQASHALETRLRFLPRPTMSFAASLAAAPVAGPLLLLLVLGPAAVEACCTPLELVPKPLLDIATDIRLFFRAERRARLRALLAFLLSSV